ncbi:hypothetical protein E3G67_002577 [Mycobacteroides abscessus]|nr:hypothetical protein [Mycobacteroides abscessus]
MLVLTRWFRRALVSGVCVAGLLGAGVVPALADPGDPPDPGIEEPGPRRPRRCRGSCPHPAAGTRCAAACGGSAGAGSRADHPAAGGAPDR